MRGERPFIYHTPNGREMFQPLQKILPALRTGAVNRSVGDGVLQWSAAEQVPLGYDVPSVGADDSARPRLARPVGRGPRAPPEGMCLLRRDTWVPPYKLFRRGRCPHRPARIALPANALGCAVPQKKGSTRAGASFTYTQCFSRLSHRLLSHVPRLWNSCTSRIRMTTATSITRYLYR